MPTQPPRQPDDAEPGRGQQPPAGPAPAGDPRRREQPEAGDVEQGVDHADPALGALRSFQSESPAAAAGTALRTLSPTRRRLASALPPRTSRVTAPVSAPIGASPARVQRVAHRGAGEQSLPLRRGAGW